VVVDTYVTDADGTGIVHQAPAFGDQDHRVCIENGIIRADEMPPCPIDDGGKFTSEVTDFVGVYVKVRLYAPPTSRMVLLKEQNCRMRIKAFRRCSRRKDGWLCSLPACTRIRSVGGVSAVVLIMLGIHIWWPDLEHL
jgi:hypothetical protein